MKTLAIALPILVLLATVGYIAWGAYKVLVIDRASYAEFWHNEADKPVPDGAVRLLAYGDSTFQGLGASEPMNGTVGRVARHIEQTTGRAVHITNRSVTGATMREVVASQLDEDDIEAADIIIVAVGANDINRGSEHGEFEIAAQRLVAALPAGKTVIADVARLGGREPYQAMLDEHRSRSGVRVAVLDESFGQGVPSWQLTARDFFHPSDKGYEWWFSAFRPAVNELIDELD